MSERVSKKRKPSSSRGGIRRLERSPPPSPPPTNNDLFSSDDQRQKFAMHFVNREILESKYLDEAYFEESNFQFYNILGEAGLKVFVSLRRPFYPELVRVFYNNMVISDTGVIRTEVKGIKIKVSPKIFNQLTSLPSTGVRYEGQIVDDWKEQYDSVTARALICRDVGHIHGRITAGQMKVQPRILHYVLTRILLPRATNIGQASEEDIMLLWALYNGLEINWGHLIRYKMKKALKDNARLPYPHLVTMFLEHFEVPTDTDLVTDIKSRQRMAQEVIGSFGYVVNEEGVWVPKENAPNVNLEGGEEEQMDQDNCTPTLTDVMNRIEQMHTVLATRLDAFETRFDNIDTTIGRRFDNFDTQFQNMDTTVGSIEEQQQHLRMRFDNEPQS